MRMHQCGVVHNLAPDVFLVPYNLAPLDELYCHLQLIFRPRKAAATRHISPHAKCNKSTGGRLYLLAALNIFCKHHQPVRALSQSAHSLVATANQLPFLGHGRLGLALLCTLVLLPCLPMQLSSY